MCSSDLPIVAVTGSNGKTTVTQMIAAILRTWMASQDNAEAALATAGNFNNDIGVPLTLLRLREGVHRCAVVELGMNHPGEIALLARIAQPTVAIVNNAQREHQEFMASVEAVALENGAAIAALPASERADAAWRDGVERVAERELAKDIDFSVQEEFHWDRTKAPWPASVDEANLLKY